MGLNGGAAEGHIGGLRHKHTNSTMTVVGVQKQTSGKRPGIKWVPIDEQRCPDPDAQKLSFPRTPPIVGDGAWELRGQLALFKHSIVFSRGPGLLPFQTGRHGSSGGGREKKRNRWGDQSPDSYAGTLIA